MPIRPVWFVLAMGLAVCGRDDSPAPAPVAAAAPETPAAAAPPSSAPPVRSDGTVYGESALMGTRVSMNVYLRDPTMAAAAGVAMQAAFDEMARIETIMSEWQPDTELSRLNAAASGGMAGPMKISPELFEVLERAGEVSEATQGAFDITFHGVGQLWSFVPGARPPTREAIRKHLPLVDWRQVELDPAARTVLLRRPDMKIGLGAIAKGYAVDRASAVLRSAGFPDHIVEGGGDTFVSGTKGGKTWVVGIQAPGRPGTLGGLPMKDRAVVTSGDYQRFFEFEGQHYSHIIDPRTGWPLTPKNSARSVTLVASDATLADAYCTAVAVMGVEAGLAYVEAHPELEAVIVRQDDTVAVSSGLEHIYIPTPVRGEPGSPPGR